jgi:hypothetical protein
MASTLRFMVDNNHNIHRKMDRMLEIICVSEDWKAWQLSHEGPRRLHYV